MGPRAIKVPITPKMFFQAKEYLHFSEQNAEKILILVETSIFCESSKSKKIAIIRNMTESKIRSKGPGFNTIRDVKPGHQSGT